MGVLRGYSVWWATNSNSQKVSAPKQTESLSSVTTTISLISWNQRDISGAKRMRPSAPRISMNLPDVVRGKLPCTAESPQLQRRHDCQCREIQSGTLQQYHQLCRTAGLGIHGSGSHCTTSHKWVLRRFAVYVRTGGHSGGMAAGRVNPIAGTYVRSKRA